MLTFAGGVHPPERKETAGFPIEKMPVSGQVTIPLSQHTGTSAVAVVKPGDLVVTGQKIGEKTGFISANVHSSITGKVSGIESRLHPSGNRVETVVIETSEKEDFAFLPPLDRHTVSPEILRDRVGEAGLVGLGGAAFPSEVKFSPTKPVDTLIINGCECEPCLSADHRVMLERTREMVEGAVIIARILKVNRVYFGVEDNKPDAFIALNNTIVPGSWEGLEMQAFSVETKYPQGAEKSLIWTLLHREVPSGGLPMDVGVIVSNVGTALAVKEAVVDGKPLYERVITVSGKVGKPANLLVRLGTSARDIIEYCGGLTENEVAVVMGGPMMGLPLPSLEFPVIKGTSGITVFSRKELRSFEYGPCLKCGRCVDICPLYLLPYFYGLYAEKGFYQECGPAGVLNCIECGACTYICPARRPIVQWVKLAKAKIFQAKKKA